VRLLEFLNIGLDFLRSMLHTRTCRMGNAEGLWNVDIHNVFLVEEMGLRTRQLADPRLRRPLGGPRALRAEVANVAGAVRRLAERVELWAGSALRNDAAVSAPGTGGRNEWHNS
jgi:hypothetical protein